MKTLLKYFLVVVFSIIVTISLLRVDRQGALMHGTDNSIGDTLQVFIENKLILQ